jgi:hypothetical protein
MKHIKLFLAGIISLLVLIQISCSSSKTIGDEEKIAQVKQQIESQRYSISVDYMLPNRAAARSLTTLYSLAVRGDTLISYLPYFGRAYSIPYGGGSGLIFTATLIDYSFSFNYKGTARISLRARSESDIFLFYIEVFSNRRANIRVTSNNREGISFSGQLEEETPTIQIE